MYSLILVVEYASPIILKINSFDKAIGFVKEAEENSCYIQIALYDEREIMYFKNKAHPEMNVNRIPELM